MIRLLIFVLISLISASPATIAQEQELSPETEAIYNNWVKNYQKHREDPSDPLYLELLKATDGDLAFLKGMNDEKDPIRRLSLRGLAELKSDRSFEIFVARLRSEDMFERESAMDALATFQQSRCVPILLQLLSKDPEPQIRAGVAERLGRYGYRDHRVVPALLNSLNHDNSSVASRAALALALLRSTKAIEPTWNFYNKADRDDFREIAMQALCYHRDKSSVEFLLKAYSKLIKRNDIWGFSLRRCIDSTLERYANMTSDVLGPVPDTVEQWNDWWHRAQPLFSQDMQIAQKEMPKIDDQQFGKHPADIVFLSALDAQSYRIGDPIRLELEMKNVSDKPYSVVFPRLPSGWFPTMGYGIKLVRLEETSQTIIQIDPSGFYQGSYAGPPPFELLLPMQTFRSSICLQRFLEYERVWPLKTGNYELTISFDPSKFARIQVEGKDITDHWIAQPIRFRVEGEPRRDPKELLQIISEKTGLKWLESDLTSRRLDRRQVAWNTIVEYGDSRLAEFLQPLEEHKPIWSYGTLRNYESTKQHQ